MRIVMPLFDFNYEDSQEFEFYGGIYSIRKFDFHEMPKCALFSKWDIENIATRYWALIAENPDIKKFEQDVNILLLTFRIYKKACIYIKYHLCKEDVRLCKRICNPMRYILPKEKCYTVTSEDINIINQGFKNLLEMETISDRTHNAGYFIYRGFCSDKMIDSFVLLMMAIESLFSSEKRSGTTKTICERVSKFLDCKPRCKYNDINNLYDLRSKIVHGKFAVESDIKDQSDILYELQYIITQCMKKILDENIYLKYNSIEDKEKYFSELVKQ